MQECAAASASVTSGAPSLWLGGLLASARETAADRLAVKDPPDRAEITDGAVQSLTWAEVGERVDRLSLALLDAGLTKGDVVMSPAPSVHETLIIQLAVSRIGAVCASFPVQYREHELGLLVRAVTPRAIISFARLRNFAHMAMMRNVVAAWGQPAAFLGYGPNDADDVVDLDRIAQKAFDPADRERLRVFDETLNIAPDDDAFIIFTSGSATSPKAVMRSHRNIIGVRDFMAELGGIGDGIRILSPRLLNTTGAIATGLVPWLGGRGTIFLHHPFSLDIFLEQIRAERPHSTSCPPAILYMMLERADRDPTLDFSDLRHISSGSANLDPSVMKAFHDRFGIEVTNSYGSSEGAMLVSSKHDIADLDDRARYFPAFGYGTYRSNLGFCKGVKTRLVSVETGEDVTTIGTPTELYVGGSTLFSRYVNDPERTVKAFDAQGFYRTGDLFELVTLDPPMLRFLGRRSNMIVRGGLNISAEEIEGLLAAHPKIRHVAVVGRPDAKLGEIVAAVVVCQPDTSITLPELAGYLKEECKVAIFKLPQHLEILTELPRLASGKPDIAAIRTAVAQQSQSAAGQTNNA